MPNDKWKKQEKRAAKQFGGKRIARSGGLWFNPGDVKIDSFLVEAKATDKKSYTLKKQTWEKINSEAIINGRMPVMFIEIENVEVAVVDKNDFLSWFKEKNK